MRTSGPATTYSTKRTKLVLNTTQQSIKLKAQEAETGLFTSH